jgi:hypothetical protein
MNQVRDSWSNLPIVLDSLIVFFMAGGLVRR